MALTPSCTWPANRSQTGGGPIGSSQKFATAASVPRVNCASHWPHFLIRRRCLSVPRQSASTVIAATKFWKNRCPPGTDFLAEVAVQWEAACQPAVGAGIRVVHVRFGIVLDPNGGALKKMILPAKLFGGALGSGRQWWSWIALEDAVGAIIHTINDESISGPVNFVAPDPIRNREFAKTLGTVLGRPAVFPAPGFVLRAAMGEMADALLLSSTRVKPTKLAAARFEYQYVDLERYLKSALAG